MSGFLTNTKVLSELMKPAPDRNVTGWIESASVLTLGEIRKGIMGLRRGSRRGRLESWLQGELRGRFEGRILPVDEEVADRWGTIAARAAAAGRAVPVIDGLIAATAIHHNLTFVTRNASDVESTGVRALNPWTE